MPAFAGQDAIAERRERGRSTHIGFGKGSAFETLVGATEYPHTVARAAATLAAVAATGVLFDLVVLYPANGHGRIPLLLFGGAALALSATLLLRAAQLSTAWTSVLCILGSAALPLAIYLAGHDQQEATSILPACAAPIVFVVSRRIAAIAIGALLAGYAVVVATASGYPDPAARWTLVASFTMASVTVSATITRLVSKLTAAERTAAAEIARLNDVLAGHVDDLARFLPPPVADAIRHDTKRSLLQPHRRRIAVLFCDLRGFTSFTMRAEPEDVVDMLSEYYTTIGQLAQDHGATLGAFIGDGALAYFGDPIPVPNPADDALSLALALRPHLDAVAERWSRRGIQLGYGLAVALGYATLGTVGHGSRTEYTALGTVVNLASRLCSEARSGDILIDVRAHDSLTRTVATTTLQLDLKGFADPVPAYRLSNCDLRT